MFVVDSRRTGRGVWKTRRFDDLEKAEDYANELMRSGFIVRFLVHSESGHLQLRWEAAAGQKRLI